MGGGFAVEELLVYDMHVIPMANEKPLTATSHLIGQLMEHKKEQISICVASQNLLSTTRSPLHDHRVSDVYSPS